jgi:hypothetical protein
MSELQEKYAKSLRQKIVAIAVKQYGWDLDQLHEIMKEWGYGESLRKLSIAQLKGLKNTLIARDMTVQRNAEWQLDAQGKYMWHLMKEIGWNRKRLVTLMIKKYHASHWNLLKAYEKRGVINILKTYQKSEVKK